YRSHSCPWTIPNNCTPSLYSSPHPNHPSPAPSPLHPFPTPRSSDPATVSITVSAVNDAPTADDQSVTTDEDTAKTITLSASDVRAESQSFSLHSQPTHGTLAPLDTVHSSGSPTSSCTATVDYTPDAN